jgi:serine/threonine-protein kinase PpkA
MNIPGYSIQSIIGRGGTATVYLAIQESLERKVALKVMSPNLGADPSFRERFVKEGRIIARLSHPNIVTVYDIGCHDEQNYMAVQYIESGCLKDRLEQPMGASEAWQVTQQVAAALGFAHDQGFIHRDVKPGNILFREDGEAVLSDFGIAKALTADTQLTAVGWTVGTPDYMSPEQAMGKEVSPASDLYSLGVLLYEMLTGTRPYEAETAIATALKHMHGPIPELPAQYSVYQPLINRLLAKEAEQRFATAKELIEEIDRLPAAGTALSSDAATELAPVNPQAPAGSKSAAIGGATLRWAAVGMGSVVVAAGLVTAITVTNNQPVQTATELSINRSQEPVIPAQLSAEESAKIDRLLSAAEAHTAIGRIVDPPGSNAYEAYLMVLDIDPANSSAIRGIAAIEKLADFRARRAER